jgi:hypothetical protein
MATLRVAQNMHFSIHQNKCSPGSKQKYMVLSPFKINALISMLKSLSQTLLQKRELPFQTIEKKKEEEKWKQGGGGHSPCSHEIFSH